jgi:hypothetical protein
MNTNFLKMTIEKMKIWNWKLNNQKGMEVMKSLQWFRYLTRLDAY